MIFIFLIGVSLIVVGGRMGITVLLFYLGQRRDLYFHLGRPWIGMARLGGTLIFSGLTLSGTVLLGGVLHHFYLLAMSIALMVAWWGLSPWLLRRIVPRWVRDFEDGRSRQDLEMIVQNGAAMLHRYPQRFRQVIRDEGGWAVWLTTVSGAVPMVSLEVYLERVRVGMERELYPLAIVAAENIIRYRPDQALGYELRAKAYFRNHQYEKALADYSSAIDFAPQNAELYYQRARLAFILHRFEAAIADLDQALELQPSQINWRHLRVIIEGQMAAQASA